MRHALRAATGISQYQNPQEAGTEFAALDVELCAKGGEAVQVFPGDFTLQMPDNTRRTTKYSGKEPGFQSTNLNPNDCVRGWVSYEVPIGQRPREVVLDTGGSASSGTQQLKWAIS
jgi:Domain of unknown function (DUF4352)